MRHRGFSIVLLYLLTQPATSCAVDQDVAGRVRMQGSIIDTPCGIAVDNKDQSIDMSVLPIEQIIRDGRGPTHKFSIQLLDCALELKNPNQPDWSTFRVTFDGTATNDMLFAVIGQEAGLGLQIADNEGNIALPGQQMPSGNLANSTTTLHYTIRMVAYSKILSAGAYRSTIRFKLNYY